MSKGILRCFLNVDLRSGHDGLSKLAMSAKVKTSEIEPGDYVVFINSARNKLKLYASNQVIAYLRLEKGRQLDMNVIRELPKVFNGSAIDYDEALRIAVEKFWEKRIKGLKRVF